ncbi:MAG: baseplate J/gp47 family protein [Gemmatimonadetes bacterium]|nr:baseplate J/gp47 family protein [Gemmatimonadota bacterium]
MPVPSPSLDDRDFAQLMDAAARRVRQSCPGWTDLTPGDPGTTILEVFAYLTEIMIYRLNRLPEKAYVEFLRMIGVQLQPPAAATARLRFRRVRGSQGPLEIPRGTRVTVSRGVAAGEPPVFVTARTVGVPAADEEAEVIAYHCELIEGERVGEGTGLPGLWLRAAHPPIIAPSGDELDLVVGVELGPGERQERTPALEYRGKAYRIWREVPNFTDVGDDRFVFVADRMTGTITFAPAVRMKPEDGEPEARDRALAEVPAAAREIRMWYRRGGGPAGNVAANTLTVLKDPIPGVEVTNPQRATGGQAAETLANAKIRGPLELHSLRRTVTARDFELVASRSGAVARAKAFTKSAIWRHAPPGTVEVLLVPFVPEEERGRGQVTVEALTQRETGEARAQIQRVLDERRPLGTTCLVNWARYKTVGVKARVVVHRQEDPAAVKARVLERLHQTVNSLPTGLSPTGWGFGQALRTSHVYDIVLAEPGVSYADQVRLVVDEVPEKEVTALAADPSQPRTWYASSGETLYRSVNDGDGWEAVARFPGETVQRIRTNGQRPGLVAVATSVREAGDSRVYLSWDCGETWEPLARLAFAVEGLAWMRREGVPILMMATERGLYELATHQGATPVQVLVDPQDQGMGFYAVEVATDVRGVVNVAVAAHETRGVYLSSQGGRPNTFRHIGLKDEDVRVLAVQYDGPRSFLWAGLWAPGNLPGTGCRRWELMGTADPADGWTAFDRDWQGGSCRALAFLGGKVMAATHRSGVAWLDTSQREAPWRVPDVGCGLPLRDVGRLHPVDTVAVDPENRFVMAAGPEGVYRSGDEGVRYERRSEREFLERVTLPETWLFCSGAHEIVVLSEDEAGRD